MTPLEALGFVAGAVLAGSVLIILLDWLFNKGD